MLEIRIHGRGGQGSVTAAHLIAAAAFYDGQFSQGFPNFGVERRGAPVTAYARIAQKFIRLRSQITQPDYIIIQDSSLIKGADVFAGVKKGTQVLINSSKSAAKFKAPEGVEIKTVPATQIAMETIGRPIINTVLLGAFAGLTGKLSLKSVNKAIKERFEGEVAQKNVLAAKKGFEYLR